MQITLLGTLSRVSKILVTTADLRCHGRLFRATRSQQLGASGPTTEKHSSVSDLPSSALPQRLEAALHGAELHLAFTVIRMVRKETLSSYSVMLRI